jgi:hypothetical protein
MSGSERSMSQSQQLERYYSALPDDAVIAAHREGAESYHADAWRIITREIATRGLQERLLEDRDAAARLELPRRLAPGLLELAPLGRRLRIAVLYTVFAVPAFVLASAFSVLALAAADSLRFAVTRAPAIAVVLSVGPALAGGFVTYHLVAERALRVPTASLPRHLWRAWPLYVGVIFFGRVFVRGWRSPGFWLFAEVLVWPTLALIGGIIADALAGMRHSRRIDRIA